MDRQESGDRGEPGKSGLCVYVHHTDRPDDPRAPLQCVDTVAELGKHFELVVVATDYRGRDFDATGASSILLANDSYDAGFFYKALKGIGVLKELAETGRTSHGSVAFFNDSVVPVAGLGELVAWGRASGLDLWGPILCELPLRHVQSYFLVFEPRAAAHLPLIFAIIGIERWPLLKDKRMLRGLSVNGFEFGASQYCQARGFAVGGQAVAGPDVVYQPVAAAAIGCPVAKRRQLEKAPAAVREALMACPNRTQGELANLARMMKGG